MTLEDKTKSKEEVADQEKLEQKEVEIPAKFKKLIEEIEKMSVLDLAEFVKALEERFGVSAVAPMVAPAVNAGAGSEGGKTADAEEKSVFSIELKDSGSQKINVIKVVKEITGKGLKEAKDIVDAAPQVIKENLKKEEAEEIKKKLEEAGATVELK